MRITSLLLLLLSFPAPLLAADDVVTNRDVIALVKAGLSVDTIAEKIRRSPVSFDTSTDGLLALAENGVPDPLIRQMIQEQAERGSAATSKTRFEPEENVSTPPPPAAVAPVVADPPRNPPAATAPSNQPEGKTYRYDAKLRTVRGGACTSELRVSERGIRTLGCGKDDLNLSWSQITSICYLYGVRPRITFATESTTHVLETIVPIEVRDMVGKIRKLTDRKPEECTK